MNCYENVIHHIKTIKEKVESSLYASGKDLENDYYMINQLSGTKNNIDQHQNFTQIFKVHEFLISEVCKVHDKEKDCLNEETFKKSRDIKELNTLLNDGKRALNMYSFNHIDYDYFFIGDLHSDAISLKRILHICDFFNSIVKNKNKRLVFLGDYVDRGGAHIKIMENILALKFIFPNNIFLLKGNHDDGNIVENEIKLPVRKPENEEDESCFLLYLHNLLKSNGPLNMDIINMYLKFFNSLCNIAFVTNKNMTLLAVHGGIPRPRKNDPNYYNYINTLSDLTDDSILDDINKTIINNMLWSDPCCNNEVDLRETKGRFRFTVEHFNKFQKVVNFDLLVRGHQAEKDGYKRFFDDRLITIFSSGLILENEISINSETAYKDITPKILYFPKCGQPSLLDLNEEFV